MELPIENELEVDFLGSELPNSKLEFKNKSNKVLERCGLT
ncbi:hypothetical protein TDB9533_01216 [Thalassocella blandensis]|nr:hypothetical protein TDB9533_01216 [Thalassocella blandensis]